MLLGSLALWVVCGSAGAQAVADFPPLNSALAEGKPPTSVEDLRMVQARLQAIVAQASRCTVSLQSRGAFGSGVIVSSEGLVLTVAHVIGKPDRRVRVRFADGRVVRGVSLGVHLELDAGLVQLEEPGPWPHLEISKQRARVGQWCGALGHPGGIDLARGPVFRWGRILSEDEFIRTDCPLIGGDSGGPLLDLQGKVIGIHSRIGTSLTNNLHVPVSVYQDNWKGLVSGKTWQSRAFIGVRGVAAEGLAEVEFVHPDSPADAVGLRAGDVVQRFDGMRVRDFPDLMQMVRDHQPGETVRMRIQRSTETLDVDITIGKRASSESAAPRAPWTRRWSHARRVGSNHQLVRKSFQPVVAPANPFTVRIKADGEQVAFGTLVDPSGLVLTKKSELPRTALVCQVPDHGEFRATTIAADSDWDFALLQLAKVRQRLPSWNWKSALPLADRANGSAPASGTIVAIPSGFGDFPSMVGVISATPRTIERDTAVLGIIIEDTPDGILVVRVLPSSGADLAGVSDGDLVQRVNQTRVTRQRELINVVRQLEPGESVELEVLRDGDALRVHPILGRQQEVALAASGQLSLGGSLSRRRSGFPEVLQHDCVLRANQCGGPLLDIDGRVLGINLARAGRVTSYAAPARAVAQVLPSLLPASAREAPVSPESPSGASQP